MKVRMPLSCAQQKRIHDDMVREYHKVAEQERNDITRRICKTFLCTLNVKFGWGVLRCSRLFTEFSKMLDNSSKDEVYWEHIDRIVIDQMGLPFERDYTERSRVSSR